MSGLDGTTGWTSASSASSVALSGLTTSNTNDIIVVCSCSQGASISSISDGASLTWQSRKTYNPTSTDYVEIWWAAASSKLSSDAITVHYGGTFSYAQAMAFGVSGAYSLTSPFDPSPSLPAIAAGSGSNGEPVVSTLAVSTFIFGLFNNFNSGFLTGAGNGFTTIATANGGQDYAEYIVESSLQNNLVVTYTGSANIIGAIGDAIDLSQPLFPPVYVQAMALQPILAQ